jgi:hypothetical protein
MTGMDGDELRIEGTPAGFEIGKIQDLRLRLSHWRRAADLGQG